MPLCLARSMSPVDTFWLKVNTQMSVSVRVGNDEEFKEAKVGDQHTHPFHRHIQACPNAATSLPPRVLDVGVFPSFPFFLFLFV